MFFFFNDTATTEIYTLSLHDALPIYKFEQICRHRLRRQNVGYSNFSQPQSHLSFCVLLQYLVERRRVVTQILKQNAKREMRLRLGKVTVADVLAAQPVTTNLIKFMRRSEERSVGKECRYRW